MSRRQRTDDHRRMAILGFDSVVNSHYFHALLEFQVGDLRSFIRSQRQTGAKISLFAYLLKAVGHTLGTEPGFNAMVDYAKTTQFTAVDIAIPIEINAGKKIQNRQYVLRDVANKSITELSAEIDACKNDVSTKTGFTASRRLDWWLTRLPRPLVRWIFKAGLKNHAFVQKMSGTSFVTSVSMFSKVPGFIIPYAGGPKAASFAFGSISQKPVVVGGEVQVREVISLTASFNHDAVDGAPAARFINKLRRLIEKDFRELLP